MSNFVVYARMLTKRGSNNLNESARLAKNGEYEAAKQKGLQGAQDILAVAKTSSVVAGEELKGLEVDIKDFAGKAKAMYSELEKSKIGKQILKELNI